jgi:glyoxylase-like metal-dependent hydrolase (beta-lactamase superfamily II)
MQTISKILAILIILAFFPILLQGEATLPLHKERLSEKALKIWLGDYMQQIAVIALATEKGIVVIETNLNRSNDVRIRRAIEEEFGRKDFKYLINTHFHHDHTAGNQIYSDATILGHKNIPAGMREELTGDGLVKLVDRFKGMLKDREKTLGETAKESEKYKYLSEFIVCAKLAIQELQNGFVPTFPTVLFEKSLILDMGDLTIELYSFGGMHTDSDIVIFVPEEGLVATGDGPTDQWLPYIRKELKSDFSITLENWGRIVESGREIEYVNMAHANMFHSVEAFEEQYRYLNALWKGLSEMFHQGLTLEDAKKRYTIEKDFPYFRDKIIQRGGIDIHDYNIEAIWERIAN